MVENKIIERFKVIKIFLLCAFVVIIAKMVYMNVVQHEYYTSLAENKTYKIMNKLIENGEEYEDNFPIVIDENGNFSYTYDKNVSDYKEKNNIPSNLNAKETFYYLVDSLIEDGTLKESDRNLNRWVYRNKKQKWLAREFCKKIRWWNKTRS